MSEQGPPTGSAPTPQAPLGSDPEADAPSVAGQLAFYQRAGGIITPLLTAVVAPCNLRTSRQDAGCSTS